jgi:hypothetical protein
MATRKSDAKPDENLPGFNRKLSGLVKKRESLRHPSFVRIGEMPIDFADQDATIAVPEPARNSHEVQAAP